MHAHEGIEEELYAHVLKRSYMHTAMHMEEELYAHI
jgi:hypothetical protein